LGDCKNVGGEIFELRLDFGAGYRIYFAYRGTKIILLLCGGDKSSQQNDIEKQKLLIIRKIKNDNNTMECTRLPKYRRGSN
jgi:putative addiction module killer protein